MDPHSGIVSPSQPPTFHVDADGLVVTSLGEAEDRVLLGNVGLSQGVHYWEWLVEMYDGRGQPSFGVALSFVSRDRMLGLDNAGWAIYLNSSRSWFLHAGQHRDRIDGGLSIVSGSQSNECNGVNDGNNISSSNNNNNKNNNNNISRRSIRPTVIGVRLDLDHSQLAFYLNGEPHGRLRSLIARGCTP
ncbi:E3 ubiquitin-protein ligase TRIM9 [Fasciolopsis buskii]|uniref:E3 ubiquitin-protein ligase TRIM9 n=1 Tax=Fasciolopsis buskii TaxID=27845 RepID=A0A8E0S7R0_9TREM|nr:E3 ubiquitin-protein ligase TRIM9 [Fasciolopsis buski]